LTDRRDYEHCADRDNRYGDPTLKTTALCLAVSLVVGGSAHAAEREVPKTPECLTLEATKAKTAKMMDALSALAKAQGNEAPKIAFPDTFLKLSPARFHFLEGVYVMNPNTPPGLPPADGALLATAKGQVDGTILWTKGDLICGQAMPVPKALIDLMDSGKLKDGSKEEMSL
jgi:hypothetical protein